MIIPIKKLRSGFSVPVLGYGTWLISGDKKRNPNNKDIVDIRSIRNAIRIGVNHFDTAENYAEGHTEEIIGEAIKNYDRKKLFITSKVSPENLRYEKLIKSAIASLKRLKISYLDLYLIHAPNMFISIKKRISC